MYEDIVELPDGQQTDYILLKGGDAVAVLAVTEDDRAVLVRQYRYPIDEVIYELPGGGTMKGESLEESARRELREEAGLLAQEMTYLGRFYASPSRSNTVVHVFGASGLSDTEREPEPYEFLHVDYVKWGELVRMVVGNEVRDVTTVFAVFMAERARRLDG